MQFNKNVLNLDPVLETDRILRFLQQHVETPVARKMIAGETVSKNVCEPSPIFLPVGTSR